jgi:hypothetical protein
MVFDSSATVRKLSDPVFVFFVSIVVAGDRAARRIAPSKIVEASIVVICGLGRSSQTPEDSCAAVA